MREAEAAWVRSFLGELRAGTLEGVDAWRSFHETGQIPPEFTDLEERVRRERPAADKEGD